MTTNPWRSWQCGLAVLLLAGISNLPVKAGVIGGAETVQTASPDYLLDAWTTEEGLPDNSVTSIAQTNDGYLWLGTFNGLARFDGVRFRVFDPANTPGMASGQIVHLFADNQGCLWIWSEDGPVTLFQNGGFEPASNHWGDASKGPPEGLDPEGNVAVGAADGHSVRRLTPSGVVRSEVLGEIREDQIGSVVVSASRDCWLRSGGEWKSVELNAMERALHSSAGAHFAVCADDQAGDIWALDAERLLEIHKGRSISVSPTGRLGLGTGLEEDRFGHFWFGTWDNGFYHIDPFGKISKIPLTPGAGGASVRCVFKDIEGNIWVGADPGGLIRIKRRSFRSVDQHEGMHGSLVKTVCEDLEGQIWAVHENGIDTISLDGTVALQWKHDLTWSASRGANGQIWAGTFSGDLFRREAGAFARCSIEGPPMKTVLALASGGQDRMWAGAESGLWRLEGSQAFPVALPDGLPTSEVRGVVEDSTGRLHAGLFGAGVLRREGDSWRRFGSSQGLADEHVYSLFADTNNTVWIGTAYAGLGRLRYDRVFGFDPSRFQLPRAVSGIAEDDFGYLWLASLDGIYRVKRAALDAAAAGAVEKPRVERFGRADGLRASGCASGTQPTVWKARDGRVWFATLSGVAVVDPRNLYFNSRPPPVTVEEALVDERPVETGPRGVTLQPGIHNLEIRYAAKSFAAPERVRFRHRLEGFDDRWTEAGDRRTAEFKRLPPGGYRFQVLACNNDGVWNEAGATLPVTVLPSLWQTLWFQSVAGLLALAGVGWLYHQRVSALQRRREAQEAFSRKLIESQENERKRIASELHDSLGQNLLLIKNRAELGREQAAGSTPPETQFDHIVNAAAQAIGEVRAIAFGLRPAELDRLGLANAARAMLNQVSETTTIRFESDLDDVAKCLSPAQEIGLYRILQEAVNNVLKHSEATEAVVELKREQRHVRLSVFDNGRGFDPQMPRSPGGQSGYGLSGLAERVSILRGEFELLSKPGRGARLTVRLPRTP